MEGGVIVDDPCLMCMVDNQHRYWNCTESCHTKQLYLANKAAQASVHNTALQSIAKIQKARDELRDED
ncbi:MAG: hypothetical protein Q8910_06570 [Bacteroidota bacterium]|nr:hypothetical protein [Bacteroidota bacterium]